MKFSDSILRSGGRRALQVVATRNEESDRPEYGLSRAAATNPIV
jgi:hypothetical protein